MRLGAMPTVIVASTTPDLTELNAPHRTRVQKFTLMGRFDRPITALVGPRHNVGQAALAARPRSGSVIAASQPWYLPDRHQTNYH
jgi:hypothetical protein